jgi:CxxC motif-containing protein (DUF1111 family)
MCEVCRALGWHHSKQGQDAKDAFNALSDEEQQALRAFLKSL